MTHRPIRLGLYSDTLVPRADGVAVSLEAAGTALLELDDLELEVVAPYKSKNNTSALPIRSVPGVDLWGRDYRLGTCLPGHKPDYDVIHVHTLGPVGVGGLYAAWRRKIPLVLTWHTDIEAYQRHYAEIRLAIWTAGRAWRLGVGAPRGYQSKCTEVQNLLRAVDLVIAPTAKVEHSLNELGCEAPTAVLPSPTLPLPAPSVSTDEIRQALRLGASDPIVLSVGRLSGEKNDELLLRMFAELVAERPDACLVLVGGYGGRVTQLIEDLGIAERVRMPGVLPRSELAGYYAAASAVVICSVTETQSLVAHEAEAAGCPLIVVDPWLYRGHEATRTFAPAEPRGLAGVVARSFRTPDPARPWAPRYRPEPREHAEKLLALYEQLAGRV
ncbi:glycosyltransferase [Kribbella sandramycini]|uniref:Glycosyltransferase n=1 Tax=Kribbella sandramycini TaxID=60450 RepID=A0A7Y4L506_9ACTN|nr:glycosyltransferase [Kribbella sandramycini]MBB6571290.1 glycosyltransferase involved in cell wall biosynthesis [Kribbella sandramycini]NOL43306.1 glycosyltransferase [Kribbella sandramycini]